MGNTSGREQDPGKKASPATTRELQRAIQTVADPVLTINPDTDARINIIQKTTAAFQFKQPAKKTKPIKEKSGCCTKLCCLFGHQSKKNSRATERTAFLDQPIN